MLDSNKNRVIFDAVFVFMRHTASGNASLPHAKSDEISGLQMFFATPDIVYDERIGSVMVMIIT